MDQAGGPEFAIFPGVATYDHFFLVFFADQLHGTRFHYLQNRQLMSILMLCQVSLKDCTLAFLDRVT
jgi:hypothetical protein